MSEQSHNTLRIEIKPTNLKAKNKANDDEDKKQQKRRRKEQKRKNKQLQKSLEDNKGRYFSIDYNAVQDSPIKRQQHPLMALLPQLSDPLILSTIRHLQTTEYIRWTSNDLRQYLGLSEKHPLRPLRPVVCDLMSQLGQQIIDKVAEQEFRGGQYTYEQQEEEQKHSRNQHKQLVTKITSSIPSNQNQNQRALIVQQYEKRLKEKLKYLSSSLSVASQPVATNRRRMADRINKGHSVSYEANQQRYRSSSTINHSHADLAAYQSEQSAVNQQADKNNFIKRLRQEQHQRRLQIDNLAELQRQQTQLKAQQTQINQELVKREQQAQRKMMFQAKKQQLERQREERTKGQQIYKLVKQKYDQSPPLYVEKEKQFWEDNMKQQRLKRLHILEELKKNKGHPSKADLDEHQRWYEQIKLDKEDERDEKEEIDSHRRALLYKKYYRYKNGEALKPEPVAPDPTLATLQAYRRRSQYANEVKTKIKLTIDHEKQQQLKMKVEKEKRLPTPELIEHRKKGKRNLQELHYMIERLKAQGKVKQKDPSNDPSTNVSPSSTARKAGHSSKYPNYLGSPSVRKRVSLWDQQENKNGSGLADSEINKQEYNQKRNNKNMKERKSNNTDSDDSDDSSDSSSSSSSQGKFKKYPGQLRNPNGQRLQLDTKNNNINHHSPTKIAPTKITPTGLLNKIQFPSNSNHQSQNPVHLLHQANHLSVLASRNETYLQHCADTANIHEVMARRRQMEDDLVGAVRAKGEIIKMGL